MRFLNTDIHFDSGHKLVEGTDEISFSQLEKFFYTTYQELQANKQLHLYFGRHEHSDKKDIAGEAVLSTSQTLKLLPHRGFANFIMSDNEIIAFSECKYHENKPNSLSFKPHVPLNGIYGDFAVLVNAEHRGKGLAQMMLLNTLHRAFINKIPVINSLIMNENKTSIRVHESIREKVKELVRVNVIRRSYSQHWVFTQLNLISPEN